MKPFYEALKDGFIQVTDLDPKLLHDLRSEGILVDDEGYHSFLFGPSKEYELALEPILDEGMYVIALYKNRVLLTEKIMVKALTQEDLDKM